MAKFERFVMERRGEYFHFLHSLQHNIPVPVLYAHLICSHWFYDFIFYYNIYFYIIDALSGEAFDLLMSLGDFMEFKDTMVAQKNMKSSSAHDSVKASATGGKGGSSGKSSGGLDLSISGHHI